MIGPRPRNKSEKPVRAQTAHKLAPSTFPEHRFGQLRFVYRGSGRPSLLVVDNLRARQGKHGEALVAQGWALAYRQFSLDYVDEEAEA